MSPVQHGEHPLHRGTRAGCWRDTRWHEEGSPCSQLGPSLAELHGHGGELALLEAAPAAFGVPAGKMWGEKESSAEAGCASRTPPGV